MSKLTPALINEIELISRTRSSVSMSAQSVSRFFPSGEGNFNCTIFSYTSPAPSTIRRAFEAPVRLQHEHLAELANAWRRQVGVYRDPNAIDIEEIKP